MELEQLTREVCRVAREAGSYIRKEREGFSVKQVERKHAHDYVSYVDKGSERMIVEALKALVPEAGFITEEGTTKEDGRGLMDDAFTWVVDPLDGTTNFIHGYAPYAVSIALTQGREMLIGVVYEVCANECFYAWKGGGAWMDDGRGLMDDGRGERLQVGNSAICDALLCLQLPYNSDAYKPVIKGLIDRFYGNVGSIRMIGSAALALCYVAAGRLDGYAERYIGQWDYMAGALIVKEAGGRVTNYAGEDYIMEGDSVVATNGVTHEALLEAVIGDR